MDAIVNQRRRTRLLKNIPVVHELIKKRYSPKKGWKVDPEAEARYLKGVITKYLENHEAVLLRNRSLKGSRVAQLERVLKLLN